jgi:hypothetical protein
MCISYYEKNKLRVFMDNVMSYMETTSTVNELELVIYFSL